MPPRSQHLPQIALLGALLLVCLLVVACCLRLLSEEKRYVAVTIRRVNVDTLGNMTLEYAAVVSGLEYRFRLSAMWMELKRGTIQVTET